jgi:hypothetical protein
MNVLRVMCPRRPARRISVLEPDFFSPVCGEPCDEQTCITCLPDERKADIVDFIMQRKLAEIDLGSDDISERLIKIGMRPHIHC